MENTVIGILLGALISWFAYAFKVRIEKRQVLNSTLFSLLRTWQSVAFPYLFGAIDFEQIALELIKEKFPDESERPTEDVLVEKEGLLFKEMIGHFSGQVDGTVLGSYQKSLSDLALFDPMLAFQISSIQNLNHVIKSYDNYVNEETQGGITKIEELEHLNEVLTNDMLTTFSGMLIILGKKALLVCP